jgi:LSD1 subclass zinc finger protein
MEYVCEVCGAAVHAFRGAAETRCAGCEAADAEDGNGHAERRALRRLLRDDHEKGRGTPSEAAAGED